MNRLTSKYTGFSYVEVMLSVIIVSVLVVSGLRLFANIGSGKNVTTDQNSAADLAIKMIEEIKDQYYKDPDTETGQLGPEAGENTSARSDFDDIDDYNNFSESPPHDRDGLELPQYADFTRSVTVRYVCDDDFTKTAEYDEGFKEVVITINRNEKTLSQQTYVIADTSNIISPASTPQD